MWCLRPGLEPTARPQRASLARMERVKVFAVNILKLVEPPGFEPGPFPFNGNVEKVAVCILSRITVFITCYHYTKAPYMVPLPGFEPGETNTPFERAAFTNLARGAFTVVGLTRIELVLLPCQSNVLPLNYRPVTFFLS